MAMFVYFSKFKKKWTDLSFDEGVRPKNIVQPNSSGTQLLIKCFVSLPFQENMDNYLHVQNLKSRNFSNFSTLLYKPFCGLLKLYMQIRYVVLIPVFNSAFPLVISPPPPEKGLNSSLPPEKNDYTVPHTNGKLILQVFKQWGFRLL